jgi:arylsulfatase A-like enzyme
VILIIDDAGTQDLGFSSKLQMEMMKVKVKDKKVEPFDVSPIRTPFIDSLAEESILFPQYYTHPTCTPSRSALMTGKYAFMNGLPFPIAGTSMIGLDPSSKTIANYFQEAGYATHMVGKWHLGHAKDIYRPPRRGLTPSWAASAAPLITTQRAFQDALIYGIRRKRIAAK